MTESGSGISLPTAAAAVEVFVTGVSFGRYVFPPGNDFGI